MIQEEDQPKKDRLIFIDEEGHRYMRVPITPVKDPNTGEMVQPESDNERRIYLQ